MTEHGPFALHAGHLGLPTHTKNM